MAVSCVEASCWTCVFLTLFVSGWLMTSCSAQQKVNNSSMSTTTSAEINCTVLPVHYCYGELLPYRKTTPLNRVGQQPYFRLRAPTFLKQSERFRYYPECWKALQPVLCALRNPKCENSQKHSFSRLMCDRMLAACELVVDNVPSFLQNCSDSYLFGQEPSDLDFSKDMLVLNFNKTAGLCPFRLTHTLDESRYYPGVAECGYQCGDLFLLASDQEVFHIVMMVFVIVCIVCSIFAIASLILKLRMVRSALFNPDKCALFMSLSFLLSSIGHLLQFFPGMRNLITCSEDGVRQVLDGHEEDTTRFGLCLLTFVLTYVFTLSGLVWFGHLMFACYLDFQKIIHSHDKTKARQFVLTSSSSIFFHGTAWLLPLVTATAVVLLQSVVGNNLLGVCWITPQNRTIKTAFVLLPFTVVLITVFVFIIFYWLNLRKSKLSQFGTLKTQKTVLNRLRLVGVMCVVMLTLHFLQLGGIWWVIYNEEMWSTKLSNFVQCSIKSLTSEHPYDCSDTVQSIRPSYLGGFYALMLSYFITGITVSSWTWNMANLRRWKTLFGGSLETDDQRNGPRTVGKTYELHPRSKRPDDLSDTRLLQQSNGWHPSVEVRGWAKRSQRNSIVSGRKITSAVEFTRSNELQDWQERARLARVERRKSDAGSSFRSGSHSGHNLSQMAGKTIKRSQSSHHHPTTVLLEMTQATSPLKKANSADSAGFIEF